MYDEDNVGENIANLFVKVHSRWREHVVGLSLHAQRVGHFLHNHSAFRLALGAPNKLFVRISAVARVPSETNTRDWRMAGV